VEAAHALAHERLRYAVHAAGDQHLRVGGVLHRLGFLGIHRPYPVHRGAGDRRPHGIADAGRIGALAIDAGDGIHRAHHPAAAAVLVIAVEVDLAAVLRVVVAVGVAGQALIEESLQVHTFGLGVGQDAVLAGARAVDARQPLTALVAA